tara:strand:- start:707 stop:1171 length:465 start_codon:yes stop_codon:yes gene_type:complete
MATTQLCAIDAARAIAIVLAKETGMTQAEILDQATAKGEGSQIAGICWRLAEELTGASAEELAAFFGQDLASIYHGLMQKDDPEVYGYLLKKVKESCRISQNAAKAASKMDHWIKRALTAERKLNQIETELEMVKKIATAGGSWEQIQEYLERG